MARIRADLLEIVAHQDPRASEEQKALGLPYVKASQVKPITRDSLCNAAAMLMNMYVHDKADHSRSVYLIEVGNVMWAQDTAMHNGPREVFFVLDKRLTRVVSAFAD